MTFCQTHAMSIYYIHVQPRIKSQPDLRAMQYSSQIQLFCTPLLITCRGYHQCSPFLYLSFNYLFYSIPITLQYNNPLVKQYLYTKKLFSSPLISLDALPEVSR